MTNEIWKMICGNLLLSPPVRNLFSIAHFPLHILHQQIGAILSSTSPIISNSKIQ